ncbi:MAG: SPFH domain-containing protein [Hyphomicrobiaceae bacterium]|nr:SPFH domain-containing protein [Hyphomicrobiaceae bacterium]
MSVFVLGVVLGAVIVFIGPSLLPQAFRNTLANALLRAVGILAILFAIASTSFVRVPDGHLGQLFRVYGGGALSEGRIVAVHGENGPQARTLAPGFHPWLLVNVLYDVDTSKTEVSIAKGKVGILTAKDGAALRAGQAFADPFPARLGFKMLDAEVFLQNGGQRGAQLSVLTPGRYRLNRYLWDITEVDAREVKAGFVGVIKSNVHADVDFGTLKADKPAACDVLARPDEKGRLDAPLVPVGCIGVWDRSLQPGQYYFNPDAFALTEIDTRAQVWTYAGGYRRANISLTVDAKGDIVQNRTEVEVPFAKEDADRAIFVKMEGWDVPLELRVVAQVSPSDASCVVAGVGTLRQIEDRVLTPSIRAITRDVAGGSYEITEAKVDESGKPILDREGKPIFVTVNRPTKVLDLINQRPLIEGEIERRIRPEAQKSCVTIREVRLGEPAIPPELLVAVRREQLATQLARAFVQERAAQEKRVDSEKAKATADQQSKLVESEINVQRSVQNAQASRNEGQGERDKLTLISEGQQKQVGVLGPEATVKLRQFELMLDTLAKFANAHPEVLTSALANAQKFVPNVQVGGGSSGSGEGLAGLLMAILGQNIAAQPSPGQPPAAGQPRR